MAVSRRVVRLLALGICLLAALALAAPRPALGQDRTPTPSAKELWEQYPLDQGKPGPTRSAAPSPARTAAGASRSPAADGSGADRAIAAMLVIVAVVAAAAGALLLLRRHRSRPQAAGMPLAPAAPGLGLAGPFMTGNRVMFTPSRLGPRPSQALTSQAHGDAAQQGGGLRPPDTARRWTAEIRWRHSDEEPRFWVVARDRQAGGVTVIARSEPLDWPPADPDAVQALVGATDALTESLVSAGWKPLPPGTAWFERRFEWEPVATPGGWAPPTSGRAARPARPEPPPPAPAPSSAPTRRFRKKPWPRGTEHLWRCEIRWSSGYARSRFEAVAHDPQRGSERVICTSTPFKWMLMGDPDPSSAAFRDDVRSLATALETAGWERLGSGAKWYSERFVWRGEDQPPDHVEPARPKARPAP